MGHKGPCNLCEIVRRVVPAKRKAIDLIILACKLKAEILHRSSMQRYLVKCICHVSLEGICIGQIIALQETQSLKPAFVCFVEFVNVLEINNNTPCGTLGDTKCIRAVCRFRI